MIQNAPNATAEYAASWRTRLRAFAARVRHPLASGESIPAASTTMAMAPTLSATPKPRGAAHDYRLAIAFANRTVGERLLQQSTVFRQQHGLVKTSTRLKLQADGSGCLLIEVRCTNLERAHLVHFVEECSATPGVSRVRWKGVPES
jgi:hypothetical protein